MPNPDSTWPLTLGLQWNIPVCCTTRRRPTTRASSAHPFPLPSLLDPCNTDLHPRFDSSVGRGDFKTKIGVGQVIRGWDDGVTNVDGGMTLGEKATLTITG